MQSDAQLPVGWDTVRLESLATEGSVTYGVVQPGQAAPDGIPMIRVNNFRGFGLDTSDVLRIGPEVEAKYGRTRLKSDDVLITIVGTVGQVAMVPPALEGWNIARAVAVIRPKEAKFARWIALALRAPESQRALGVAANTTVQTTINLKDLRQLLVPIPPTEERQAIEQLLCSLDDRIDLLRQTNTTLESIAQALFKSWFIDFDPVRAKQAGREPEGMDTTTAALFPAGFEESALGLIPKGWRVLPFAETVDIVGGGTPKTSMPEYWDGAIPWFSVVDAPAAGQVFTVATEKSITKLGVKNSSTRILPKWTTIISARGTVGKVGMTGVEMAMNQSCYGLKPRANGGETTTYLAAQRLVADLKRLAHGGVFDTITRDTLNSVLVCTPPAENIKTFDALTRPLFERILANGLQSRSLTETRDTLLPRLISGKLRLPEAQEQLEDALA